MPRGRVPEFSEADVLIFCMVVWWAGAYPSFAECERQGLKCDVKRFYLIRSKKWLATHGIARKPIIKNEYMRAYYAANKGRWNRNRARAGHENHS